MDENGEISTSRSSEREKREQVTGYIEEIPQLATKALRSLVRGGGVGGLVTVSNGREKTIIAVLKAKYHSCAELLPMPRWDSTHTEVALTDLEVTVGACLEPCVTFASATLPTDI